MYQEPPGWRAGARLQGRTEFRTQKHAPCATQYTVLNSSAPGARVHTTVHGTPKTSPSLAGLCTIMYTIMISNASGARAHTVVVVVDVFQCGGHRRPLGELYFNVLEQHAMQHKTGKQGNKKLEEKHKLDKKDRKRSKGAPRGQEGVRKRYGSSGQHLIHPTRCTRGRRGRFLGQEASGAQMPLPGKPLPVSGSPPGPFLSQEGAPGEGPKPMVYGALGDGRGCSPLTSSCPNNPPSCEQYCRSSYTSSVPRERC